MAEPAACTIVARNYLAQARVLFASFREHHPDIAFTTLVVDADPSDGEITGVGAVATPADLDLDTSELHTMMAIYDVMEFSTALKPALLMHLLRTGASVALYFDPDIRVFTPLDDVFEAAAESGIVLTPHVLTPFPDDDKIVSERMVMLAGIFNLGFVGVHSSAYRFLGWWNEKLSRHAISDPSKALFTDQRWIDWVPSLFPHRILRDPGLNVAHWNLHERRIGGGPGAWTAGGHPLRFLHFSGYDPHSPWLLSKHTRDDPRVVLSADSGLQTLCDDYGAELLAAGYDEMRAVPYRYTSTPGGVRIGPGIRRLVRSIDAGELRGADPMPDPFGTTDAFARWLLTPGLADRFTPLTPLEVGVWLSRPDLQSAFPGALAESGQVYRDWFAADPDARSQRANVLATLQPADNLPEPSAPADRTPAARGASAQWSVLVLTDPGSDEHEVAARIADALLRSGTSVTLVDAAPSRDGQVPPRLAAQIGTDGVIVVLAAGQRLYSDLALVLGRPETLCIGVVLGSAEAVARSSLLTAGWTALWVVGEATAERVRSAGATPPVQVIAYPARPMVPEASLVPQVSAPGLEEPRDPLLQLHVSPSDTAAERAAQVAVIIDGAHRSGRRLRVILDEDGLAVADREHLRWLLRADSEVQLVEPDGIRGALTDVAVWLTKDPGLALGVVRAQIDGIPVLSMDGPSRPWSTTVDSASLIPETATGFDHAHAVRALATLLRSTATRERIAAHARDHVSLRFSVAEIAADYRALLSELDPGGES